MVVALGGPMWATPWLCAGLALAALLMRRARAGLGLWSSLVPSLHGSGLMLVPAFVSLCLGKSPAGEITKSGSLATAVHTLAMLVVTAALAQTSKTCWRRWISILEAHEPSPRTQCRPRR